MRVDAETDTAIIADTGGTSYDVSLVRGGLIPLDARNRGATYRSDMTALLVMSASALAAVPLLVDAGGLPYASQSAGSSPGPACSAPVELSRQ
jgi:N-methylhydantoinase A